MKLLKYLTFSIFLLSSVPVLAQQFIPIELTGDSKISMLTCSPGAELYSTFGHSAIRVKDPNLNIDIVFNYGTFDFATPNFYAKFVKGKLNYILSVSSFPDFIYEYVMEERWVVEQVLDVSLEEKQSLFDSLRINYLPENREYLYDFFFDNCATRIRDIFYEKLEGVEFDYSETENNNTFRDLLKPYIKPYPWVELGINLALGARADRIASPWETMFLPDHMLDLFRDVRIERDSATSLLCYPETIIFAGVDLPEKRFKIHNPMIVFWALFVLGTLITFFDLKRRKPSKWFDIMIFGFTGLLGVLFVFLWFGTDHTVMVNNYNLLWAIPLHFPALFIVFRKKYAAIARKYFFITSVILLLVVVLWRIIPQELPLALLPFVLLMMMRALLLSRNYNRK
jgi:hypothetical protein